MLLIKSIGLFIAAGLCEIGGGYLVWIWLREGRSAWLAVAGAVVLFLYGIVPTYQPANFGRVYAAYGGIFVVLSIFWGWKVDQIRPDRYDLIGGLVCLVVSASSCTGPGQTLRFEKMTDPWNLRT